MRPSRRSGIKATACGRRETARKRRWSCFERHISTYGALRPGIEILLANAVQHLLEDTRTTITITMIIVTATDTEVTLCLERTRGQKIDLNPMTLVQAQHTGTALRLTLC